jgi:putative DNA primase/helicase
MTKKNGCPGEGTLEKAVTDKRISWLDDTSGENTDQALFQLGVLRERLACFADRDPADYAEVRTRICVHLGWGTGEYWKREDEEHPGFFEQYLDSFIYCQRTGFRILAAMPSPQTYPDLKDRPCFRCYSAPFAAGFKAGVYQHVIEKDKDTQADVSVDRWICSILRVLAIVRTESGAEHGYLIEYVPHGESQPRREVMSQALLLGRGDDALRKLRDIGVSILGANSKHVRDYLDAEHLRFSVKEPDDFWTRVKVVGWYPMGKRFVLPNQVIGAQEGVWFSGQNDGVLYSAGGKFDDWKAQVAALCIDNFYLQLALSCAFTGPLLELLNIPGLGFHYFGDSTLGKSTALAIAASVWGPERFMLSWRNTINGLEGQAVRRSSTLIPIDESHQVDPKTLGQAVYMLLNGIGKGRMDKSINAREIDHWRVCVLSSGERSIETHQTAAKIDHKVGQMVRMIDVPVVNGQYGLFTDIHGRKNGAEFSDALREAAGRNYGHAGIRFITELINRYQGLNLPVRLDSALQGFEKIDGPLGAQDRRVARSFALAAVAGELAIEWGILPWNKCSALIAAMEIFHTWKQTQPQSSGSKETQQLLQAVNDFIQTYGACFSDIDWAPRYDPSGRLINAEPVIHERAGYWKDIGGKRIYLFTSEGLAKASGGFGTRKAAEVLDSLGALVEKGADKRSKPTDTPDGNKKRLYWVDPEKLEDNP